MKRRQGRGMRHRPERGPFSYARSGRLAAVCVTALFLLSAGIFPARAAQDGYLRAAAYYSDAWVINFWNTESDHMEEELAQIAADGFNCIVLMIPWREFQPTTEPVSYNNYAFAKLDSVMRAAGSHGLGVMLRVGYTWDYYKDENASLRYRELLEAGPTRRAFIQYVGHLYETASGYSNFRGGFITWEDFWNYVEDAGSFGNTRSGRSEAGRIGFVDYLMKRYDLETLSRYWGENFESYSDIYIPDGGSYAYRLFYDFYDDFLGDLLGDCQAVFPNLSMEVRLDEDRVQTEDGSGIMWVSHQKTFPCGSADFTSLMYSVSMGRERNEVLSANQALETMNSLLNRVRTFNGGKPIFVDQLLYMDVTEGFETNARLSADERPAYLMGLPAILNAYSNGYAVWTYRNYMNNAVYNCQFALGKRGWMTSRASIEDRAGSRALKLSHGGTCTQKIGQRIGGKSSHENHLRFTVDSDETVFMEVTLGSNTRMLEINGRRDVEFTFDPDNFYDLSFTAYGDVWIDNISVWNFVQDGQLRDLDGAPLSCLPAIRALNASLQ